MGLLPFFNKSSTVKLDLKSIMNNLINKISKYRKFLLLTTVIFGIFFYTFWSSLANKDFVIIPQMFSDARIKSDTIAEEFVTLSKSTKDNLENIKSLEESGNSNLALTKIREEISQGDSLKAKGTELLASLSQMTYSLGGIRPEAARATAYEAINYRIEMIGGLISYSNELEGILKLLTSRVIYGDNIHTTLQDKIDSANNNAKKINDLNAKFNDAMKKLENL